MGVWNEMMEQSRAHRPQTKTILLAGGSKETQRQLISKLYIQEDTFLSSSETNYIANEFHLGYTYIQYRDGNGHLLATLDVYTIPDGSAKEYKDILTQIMKKIRLDDFLFVPLLDYTENPENWLRMLSTWISLLHYILEKREFSCMITVLNRSSKMDWDQDIHEYIQLSLRSISLSYRWSVLYTTKEYRKLLETVASLMEIQVSDTFRPQVKSFDVDYQEFFLPSNADSWIKISALSETIDPEKLVQLWHINEPDNEYIKKYESIVPGIPTESGESSKKSEYEKPKAQKYQQFLESLYELQQKKKRLQRGI